MGLDPIFISLAGFLVNIIVLVATGIWGLSRHSQEVHTEINKVRMEVAREHDEFMSRFGDALGAIRQKVTDVELWARDEFIRREDFYRIVDGLSKSITALGEKIESRTDRLEAKIDKINGK